MVIEDNLKMKKKNQVANETGHGRNIQKSGKETETTGKQLI